VDLFARQATASGEIVDGIEIAARPDDNRPPPYHRVLRQPVATHGNALSVAFDAIVCATG
jgi:hypothetical protein